MDMLTLVLGIFNCDLEHFTEVLSQAVGRSSLNTSAVRGDVTFNGCSVVTSSKLLVVCLLTANDRNSKKLLVHPSIQLQDLQDFLSCQLFGKVSSVAFLPQELSGSEERGRLLSLPAHNGVPLVQSKREVSMAADPFRVVRIHDCLGCRTDSDGDLELLVTSVVGMSVASGERNN
jgi:hypothetical protein